MNFRIADSFTKALSKLGGQEQSAVKITVFDMQQDPSAPGLQFHRIDKSKDPNFWSIRKHQRNPLFFGLMCPVILARGYRIGGL